MQRNSLDATSKDSADEYRDFVPAGMTVTASVEGFTSVDTSNVKPSEILGYLEMGQVLSMSAVTIEDQRTSVDFSAFCVDYTDNSPDKQLANFDCQFRATGTVTLTINGEITIIEADGISISVGGIEIGVRE